MSDETDLPVAPPEPELVASLALVLPMPLGTALRFLEPFAQRGYSDLVLGSDDDGEPDGTLVLVMHR